MCVRGNGLRFELLLPSSFREVSGRCTHRPCPVVGFTLLHTLLRKSEPSPHPLFCAHFKRFSLHADWAGHRPPSKRTTHCTARVAAAHSHITHSPHCIPPLSDRAGAHQALPLRGSSQGHHAFQRWRSSRRQDSKSSRTLSLLVHAGITDSISPPELRFHSSITACHRVRPVTRKSAICS
jgi:hypothetical protein